MTYQQRELIIISALASIEGLESQLKVHIGIGKNTGITDHQLIQSAELIAKTVNLSQAEIFRKIINENSLK